MIHAILLFVNRLSTSKRVQILSLLLEGMSMRSVSRITGASINTVTKLMLDAGAACLEYHNDTVRNVRSKRVQVDEIWSFTYAKQANVTKGNNTPEHAGDTWTWTAIDADSKMILTWLVGPRDLSSAYAFMVDLSERLADRVQITSDGLKAYLDAVEDAFVSDVDYSQLVKIYGSDPQDERRYSPAKCLGAIPKTVTGNPDPKHISTSYVERHNLTMRMAMRRFTRLTNAFSKRVKSHVAMLSLYFVWYNFCRIHKTLRVTPAMEASIAGEVRDVEWIIGLIDARAPQSGPRGPYKNRNSK